MEIFRTFSTFSDIKATEPILVLTHIEVSIHYDVTQMESIGTVISELGFVEAFCFIFLELNITKVIRILCTIIPAHYTKLQQTNTKYHGYVYESKTRLNGYGGLTLFSHVGLWIDIFS